MGTGERYRSESREGVPHASGAHLAMDAGGSTTGHRSPRDGVDVRGADDASASRVPCAVEQELVAAARQIGLPRALARLEAEAAGYMIAEGMDERAAERAASALRGGRGEHDADGDIATLVAWVAARREVLGRALPERGGEVRGRRRAGRRRSGGRERGAPER